MNTPETEIVFDSSLLAALPSTTEALALHILRLARLDAHDIADLLNSEEGMLQISAGMQLQGVSPSRGKFSDLVEADPSPMTDEEYARFLKGGTRTKSVDLPRLWRL